MGICTNMHTWNVFTPYTSVLYCTKLNQSVYVLLRALGQVKRSHVEAAGQASQQGGAAKLLMIDFCLSVGADWQWTTLVRA